jgi:hypothetical protein
VTTQEQIAQRRRALTHGTEEKDVHAQRMKPFQEICKRMKVGEVMYVPVEHDAGPDGGQLYREFFKETYYPFDHRRVYFVALDNVSRAKPEQLVDHRSRDFAVGDACIEGNSG